jgi:hypothetical protein
MMTPVTGLQKEFIRQAAKWDYWVHPLVVYRAAAKFAVRTSNRKEVLDKALSESITMAERLHDWGYLELSVDDVTGNRLHMIRLTDEAKKFLKYSRN